MKTRAFIIILFTLFLKSGLYSQQLSLRWTQQFGNTGWDYVSCLKSAGDNGFIVAGSIKGCLPGDTLHPFLVNNSNAWLAACDSTGNILWQKVFGGKGVDCVTSVVPVNNGILFSGLYQDTLFVDPLSIGSSSFSSAFIGKAESEDGNITQIASFGQGAFINNILLDKDPAGDVYVAGAFSDSLTLAGSLMAKAGDRGLFMARLLPDGTVVTPHVITCRGKIAITGLCCNDSLTVITGAYSDTLVMEDTTLVSAGASDGFIAVFNQAGTLRWYRTFGGIGNDKSSAITFSETGDLAVTGDFEQASLFDNTILASAGGKDIFVSIYSPTGTLKWIQRIGSVSDDRGYAVAFDSDNELFISGNFVHVLYLPDENGNLVEMESTSPFGNAFIAKYNENGVLKASFNLPGTSEDYCRSLVVNDDIVTAAGNFYESIQYTDSLAIFYNLESSGSKDIFLMQFRDMCDGFAIDAGSDTVVCPGQTITIAPPAPYATWQWLPGGAANQELVVTDPGTYTLTVTNNYGCIASDSINVTQASLPQVFSGNDTLIEAGDILYLNSAAVDNADSFHWETSGDGYFFNNEQLHTDYSLSFSDISAGSVYLYLVAQNQCSTVADSLLVSLPVANDGVTVYPNPASDLVTLVCTEGLSINTVTITRQTGEVIQSGITVNSFMYQYNLYPYSPGTFVFHATLNNGVTVSKIVNKI